MPGYSLIMRALHIVYIASPRGPPEGDSIRDRHKRKEGMPLPPVGALTLTLPFLSHARLRRTLKAPHWRTTREVHLHSYPGASSLAEDPRVRPQPPPICEAWLNSRSLSHSLPRHSHQWQRSQVATRGSSRLFHTYLRHGIHIMLSSWEDLPPLAAE